MAGIAARLDIAQERDRLFRFLVLGAANTGFAYGIYAAGLALGLSYQLASLIALVAGVASGFFLQGKMTFRAQLDGRFVPFVGLWVLLYFANITLIGALAVFGANYYWAGLIAALPVNALSFLAMRTLIFVEDRSSPLRLMLCWCLGLVVVARLHIATHLSANWDEFLNLSMLYDFRRGEMTEIFQTAFIHLFRWLPLISDNEVDQVIGARFAGLMCVAITSWAIYRSSRRFTDTDSALVSVLAFNCFGYSLLYGADFRTDTLATAAMMAAVAIASRRVIELASVIALGVLIGVGGAMTIKSFLFLPTIALLVLSAAIGFGEFWRSARILAAGAAASLAVFASILMLHASGLQDHASAVTFLGRTGGATLLTGDYTVFSTYWKPALLANMGFWALVIVGLATTIDPGRAPQSGNRLALFAFALPALIPLVYSEVYPYYHPFLVAPLAVLAGVGFGRLTGILRFALVCLLLFSAANSFVRRMDDGLQDQRCTLALVHRLFPKPTTYIDHTSMVSSYLKQGFFMSRWGVTDYRAEGRPVMAGIIAEKEPKFLLETRSLLAVDRISPELSDASEYGLFRRDVESLRDNYIRYWGPLFLPGKALSGVGKTKLLIGGAYRVDASEPLQFAGRTVQPGEVLDLEPGIFSYSVQRPVRLLWAAPPAPTSVPPKELFAGW